MTTEACNLALKNTLNEIKNVCPEISHSFVFRENGTILARDENTNEAIANEAQETLRSFVEKANVVGGIESINFRGTESQLNLLQFEDIFITTVSSNDADEKTISNLARIMIPTTFKVMQKIYPSFKSQSQETVLKLEPESIGPEVPASEFTVENLTVFGGFMIDPDTAYIDVALIVQWAEMYGDKPITQIALEVPTTGKTTQCKFKAFKDKKFEDKGLVQLSEKIQTTLRIQKGSKVLIKPILGVQEDLVPVKAQKNEKYTPPVEQFKPQVIKKNEKKVIQPKKMMDPEESIDFSNTAFLRDFEKCNQDAPVMQVMVEDIGGLAGRLGTADSVRVDNFVVARWNEIFGEKEIKEVIVEETVFGKEIRCKFQPIKDAQLEGKGVIQIPDKLQQALATKKGALVLVKPVVGLDEE